MPAQEEPNRAKPNDTPNRTPEKPDPDLVQRIIGQFGRYHVWLCFLLFLSKFPSAFHLMAIIFLAPKISYTCPQTNDQTCPCPDPVYDTDLFKRTITTEWELICDKSWLRDLSQSLFQLGTLVGSVFFGMASDRFGRKCSMLAAVVLQISTGVAAAYTNNFWLFTFIRFLIGMSVGGTLVVGFVIVMEFVGTEYRDIISALYHIPFNMGHILLPAFGYFFRDFSHFQLAISLPTFVLLTYACLLPESPRWLLAVNRTDKAIKILERVARINKRPVDQIKAEVEANQEVSTDDVRPASILDLMRKPNLRRNTLAMSFNWLACSYCFYGVSQYIGQLKGNVFLNVAASASFTLIGTLLAIPMMRILRRKTLIIIFHLICAFSLLLLAVVPDGVAAVILACIGVFASFVVFVIMYLYCSEVFPTVVRTAALGVSSMMARFGSMVAPFIVGLHEVRKWIPPVAFGVMPILAALLCLLLPETKSWNLMSSLDEGENYGKKEPRVSGGVTSQVKKT